jgi:hypothetical protein
MGLRVMCVVPGGTPPHTPWSSRKNAITVTSQTFVKYTRIRMFAIYTDEDSSMTILHLVPCKM